MIEISEPAQNVFVATLQHLPDNRFNFEFCAEILKMLDKIEAIAEERAEPCALITTGTGKFYSNGLALDSVLDRLDEFFTSYYHVVLRRMLTTPLVTVAAINGHAFAGGLVPAQYVNLLDVCFGA